MTDVVHEIIAQELSIAEMNGEDNVLVRIGALSPDVFAGGSQDKESLKELGIEWWEKNSPKIKEAICYKEDITRATSTSLIDAVFGVLSLKYGEALAVYISVLVIRRLLAGWCLEPTVDKSNGTD